MDTNIFFFLIKASLASTRKRDGGRKIFHTPRQNCVNYCGVKYEENNLQNTRESCLTHEDIDSGNYFQTSNARREIVWRVTLVYLLMYARIHLSRFMCQINVGIS